MYVDPFVAGVIAAIATEALVLIVAVCVSVAKDSKAKGGK